MTQDILKYLIKLPGPPSPAQPLDMVPVLRSMSATLSACVFQSLMCGREEGDTNVSGESTVFVNMIYSQKFYWRDCRLWIDASLSTNAINKQEIGL